MTIQQLEHFSSLLVIFLDIAFQHRQVINMKNEVTELRNSKLFCQFSHKVLEKVNHYQSIQQFFQDSLQDIAELLDSEKMSY